MIDQFLEQISKEPDIKTLHKAKLAIIDWIGYSIAGTFTKQAYPFKNLQSELPKGNSLNLFDKKSLILSKSPPGSVTAAFLVFSFQITQLFCIKGVTGIIATFRFSMI